MRGAPRTWRMAGGGTPAAGAAFAEENPMPTRRARALRSTTLFAGLCLAAIAAPAAAWDGICNGTATYTGSGYSGGAVLLDPIPADAMITALNPTQMNYGG